MLEKTAGGAVRPISQQAAEEYPRAYRHLIKLAQLPEFEKHITPLTRDLV
jgi:hypothetical protein